MSASVLEAHRQQMKAEPAQAATLRRGPSSEEVQELGQTLSLLHTAPPRTVFADRDRAWRAVIAARELHRRTMWGEYVKSSEAAASSHHAVDTAIQLVTILLDAAERLRRDGNMEEAAGLLDDAVRYVRSMQLLVPFLWAGHDSGAEADRSLAMSRFFKAEAEVCMRFALLLVPAREMNGELIGLVGAYSLIEDAAAAESYSNSNDWQAAQMIGLVREAICSALSWQSQWQSRQERVANSILDSIRPRIGFDEGGNELDNPLEIRVLQPVASDAAELEAKLSARKDLTVRFGNLGEAFSASEDDVRLPPGAGVMFQCWLPCVEAYVMETGAVRLRSQDYGPEEYMIRELSLRTDGPQNPVDLVRLETSEELGAVLRMLHSNILAAGVADDTSNHCLPALNALFRVALNLQSPQY